MNQVRDFNANLSVRINEWRAKEGLPSLKEAEKASKNQEERKEEQPLIIAEPLGRDILSANHMDTTLSLLD